jgi:Protein of unknown function (DUF3108)
MVACLAARTPVSNVSAQDRQPEPFPFPSGENLNYLMKFGILHVGSGSLHVEDMDSTGELLHFVVLFEGGSVFFRVNDAFESWFDRRTMRSVRFVQTLNEGSEHSHHVWDFCHASLTIFDETADTSGLSVADPLDDASFLYFIRTVDLEVGRTYTFDRYFKKAENPVVLRVTRRERVSVPAGTFDAFVVEPTVNNGGIFAGNRRAEVWIADDSTHVLLKIRSHLPFASLTLALKSSETGKNARVTAADGTKDIARPGPGDRLASPIVAAGGGCAKASEPAMTAR